jgi:hypothetical protein
MKMSEMINNKNNKMKQNEMINTEKEIKTKRNKR